MRTRDFVPIGATLMAISISMGMLFGEPLAGYRCLLDEKVYALLAKAEELADPDRTWLDSMFNGAALRPIRCTDAYFFCWSLTRRRDPERWEWERRGEAQVNLIIDSLVSMGPKVIPPVLNYLQDASQPDDAVVSSEGSVSRHPHSEGKRICRLVLARLRDSAAKPVKEGFVPPLHQMLLTNRDRP